MKKLDSSKPSASTDAGVGTVGDIDWYAFAHSGPSDCVRQQRQLYIDERGTSGDLTEVWIRCDCKQERSLAQAAKLENRALGLCDGSRPWLGPFSKESCGEPSRLLIRSASNSYFPQLMSVISLPDRDAAVRQAVDVVWEYIEAVEDLQQLQYERKKAKVKAALEGISDEDVFQEIQIRRLGGARLEKSVKVAELETLVAAKEEITQKGYKYVFRLNAPADVYSSVLMDAILALGKPATIAYICLYAVINLAAFGVVATVVRRHPASAISDYRGLASSEPASAVALGFGLVALAVAASFRAR